MQSALEEALEPFQSGGGYFSECTHIYSCSKIMKMIDYGVARNSYRVVMVIKVFTTHPNDVDVMSQNDRQC